MAKINISIPDDLLKDVDDLAAELVRSRSGLVAEATARYVTAVRDEQATAERRERIARAIASAREIAEKFGAFDGTASVREDRDGGHRTGSGD